MKASRAGATVLTLALVVAACGSDDNSSTDAGDDTAPSTTAEATTTIESRVIDNPDIGPGDFSNPTEVNNEYYPVSELTHVVMLGEDEGEPLRVEVTLLPDTKTIEWGDGETETVTAQFIALSDDEIVERTDDWFAQDDDGNVWYFGEAVENYEDGVLADTDGSWIAGSDGPPGLIMPADPQVGDLFHSENIPDLVYEEDLVVSTTETVEGPSGPIEGALKIQETVEGTLEEKYWAPGYGEFRAIVPDEEDVVLVFALPNDATGDAVPVELDDLVVNAIEIGAPDTDADRRADLLEQITTTVEEGNVIPDVAAPFGDALEEAVDELTTAVEDDDDEAVAEAAIAVELSALDVLMTYGELPDLARIDALNRRLQLELAAGDETAAFNTATVIDALWARSQSRYPGRDGVGEAVGDLTAAVEAEDLDAIGSAADALSAALPGDDSGQ